MVLFVSGDGRWNLGVVDMARALAKRDTLVAGIDIIHYLQRLDKASGKCSYPAADFEGLSQYLQKYYKFKDYVRPVLAGYSSGATLVYAIISQSPPNTFLGSISLSFCPDLPVAKPFCRGQGLHSRKRKDKGYDFLPDKNLRTPWITLQGTIDQVCDPKIAARLVSQSSNATFVSLPHVGHGFGVQRNWMPQFQKAFTTLTDRKEIFTPTTSELKALPLIEEPSNSNNDVFAVVISGDGGWASIDRQIAKALKEDGVSVVGLDSLHYFWKRRTPKEGAKDLARIISYYLHNWHKKKVILVGYSRGADVLPFMVSRLPEQIQDKVQLLALLGVEHKVDFEFHMADWIPGSSSENAPYDVKREVLKLEDLNVLCVYGEDEHDSICHELNAKKFHILKLSGGHHFGGNYKSISAKILEVAKK